MRFYFDVDSDGRVAQDDTGTEIASIQQANHEAVRLLREMIPNAASINEFVTVTVRNEAGLVAFRTTLKVETEWES